MDPKEILKDLIKINTINDKENDKIISYIEKKLKDQGFITEYKSKCLVMRNKEICDIGFLGHTDTVSCSNDWNTNPFELTQIDNKLYGLGTCDMKGSIAAMLSAVSKIDFSKTNKGIKLFFTFDEEIGFSGINELTKKIDFPNNIIIGEPTNNEIINGSKGLLELKFTFKGITSHASCPKEGQNAIEKCVEFINIFKKYFENIEKETIENKSATMNIGIINGGISSNIVPDRCELIIDFRTITANQNISIINRANELLEASDKCEIINNIPPFLSKSEENNISDFITEASFINSRSRIILGCGPVNPHKKDEYIYLDSLEKLESQYMEIINDRI